MATKDSDLGALADQLVRKAQAAPHTEAADRAFDLAARMTLAGRVSEADRTEAAEILR